MDPVLVWAVVAVAGIAGAYDVARKWIGDVKREEITALTERCDKLRDGAELARQDAAKLRADFDAFVAADKETWNSVGKEWTAKVAQLEERVNSVTTEAKNEINGALQGVDALTAGRKGWR